MKSLKAILPLFLAAWCACAAAQTVQRYEIRVNDFTELKVTDGINVDYRQSADSAGLAVFTSPSDKASLLLFSPKKQKLEVQLALDGTGVTGLPTVTVYSSALAKVENAGDSLVRVIGAVSAPERFKARLIGNGRLSIHSVKAPEVNATIMTGRGTLVIAGSCDKASLSVTGTGTIQADGLRAASVACKIIGTGTIGCAPVASLSVHGMGSGTVYYTGSPASIAAKGLGIKTKPLQ